MEKSKPHYNLKEIKKAFSDADNLGIITASARDGARQIRLANQDIVAVIQSLKIKDFYKSMTSYKDHTIWHDVYSTIFNGIELYIKITVSEDKSTYVLISFKQRRDI